MPVTHTCIKITESTYNFVWLTHGILFKEIQSFIIIVTIDRCLKLSEESLVFCWIAIKFLYVHNWFLQIMHHGEKNVSCDDCRCSTGMTINGVSGSSTILDVCSLVSDCMSSRDDVSELSTTFSLASTIANSLLMFSSSSSNCSWSLASSMLLLFVWLLS